MSENSTPRFPSRLAFPRGLATMVAALVALAVLGAAVAPSSISSGAMLGMLPFAAVLAIVGLGQMLVVQQGGIDLSVPGAISLSVVIISHEASGQDALVPIALLLTVAASIGAGLVNAVLVARLGLSPIIVTLGTNALLLAAVLGVSGGIPRGTAPGLAAVATGNILGVPDSVLLAGLVLLVVAVGLRKTPAGRRFEVVGTSGRASQVLRLRVRTHRGAAYVLAQLLYAVAGVLLCGLTAQPTAYQGSSYLMPSVAVVVLAGTSLLGGRGYPVATVAAALFLSQLDQFALALGVPDAAQTLVQAAALAAGVATYTIPWSRVAEAFRGYTTAKRRPMEV